jgi:hypothetical protein
VTENDLPDAGTDATIDFCENAAPVALSTLLGGTPDAGGAWSLGAMAVAATFTPATGTPGAYVYTVSGTAPCPSAQATVTIGVSATADAGGNGVLTLCSSGAAAALLPSLTGTPSAGGAWTGPGGTASDGTYTPGTSAPGIYTYEVAAVAPCPNATATVTVSENDLPDAGSDAIASFCESAAAQALVDLLGGTPDAGGTWTGPDGLPYGATLDPGTANSGSYTYTITGIAPCPSAQSSVDITIEAQPTAGTDGTVNLCEGSAATDLFLALGGVPDAGGTWSDPNGNVTDATFDPNTELPGTYTYTVSGTAPCVDATATVEVSVSPQPNAGTDALLSVCSDGSNEDLFGLLGIGAIPGGTWVDPDGAAHDGTYIPGTSASGIYTYTIVGVAPCITSSATVTVSQTTAADPGADGALTACSNGAAVDLFDQLGGTPDAGGVWTAPGGGASGGSFNPATDASGAYTYTLASNGPCAAMSATVTMTAVAEPDAGADGDLSYCSSSQTAFTLIGGLNGPARTAWRTARTSIPPPMPLACTPTRFQLQRPACPPAVKCW